MLTPATAAIPKTPVTMPIVAVNLLNTPFRMTIPITRNANERVPIAHTRANGDSSTADTYVAAATKLESFGTGLGHKASKQQVGLAWL